MRIAITGASGNIGSAVLRRLSADGEHQIVGVARRVPGSGPDGTEVRWVSADLTKDEGETKLERALDGADAVGVRCDVLAGMRHRDSDATPALRRRSVAGATRNFATGGPVGQRNRP